jgi:hypothetical protein
MVRRRDVRRRAGRRDRRGFRRGALGILVALPSLGGVSSRCWQVGNVVDAEGDVVLFDVEQRDGQSFGAFHPTSATTP